jgi:gamma-glutamylcyclotransferase (GGCT)/AIG2-like uncharacterized protein YtfP
MHPTELFVYGTLRHDQPEHARYCRGVTGWRRARLCGRLFRLTEGYLLLVLPSAAILHQATGDPVADETRRQVVDPASLARSAAAMQGADGARWIEGELLVFSDAAPAWPPLDRWEGVSPGVSSVYARLVVPVLVEDAAQSVITAWVYAATHPPVGALEVTLSGG